MAEKSDNRQAGQALHDLFREVFALHAALTRIMDAVHEKSGLSAPQHKVMSALSQMGPATVPEAAARMGVSRQFVQTVCNDLQSRGFLEFEDNPRHKRSRLATLTETGCNAYRQSRENENNLIEQTLPGINPDKVTDARNLLALVREAVEKLPQDFVS